MDIKAKFIAAQEHGKNYAGDKELTDCFKVIAYSKGELVEVVDCRVWMGRSRNASKVYATLWVHGKGIYTSGTGNAGGYGYCKTSAAIDEAIRSAGFKLDRSVSGTGQHRDALEAVARSLGFRKFIFVSA